MVLGVQHSLAAGLGVGRRVEVGIRDEKAALVGHVGKRPAKRVRRGEGDEASGLRHAGEFAHEGSRVGDERDGAEGGEHDVERVVGEGQARRVTLRESRPGVVRHGRRLPGVIDVCALAQHAQGQVGGDDPRSLVGAPTSGLCCSRAELEHVTPVEAALRAQNAQFRLGPALRSPDEFGVTEESAVLGQVLVGLAVPPGAIGPGALWPRYGEATGAVGRLVHGPDATGGGGRPSSRPRGMTRRRASSAFPGPVWVTVRRSIG